MSDSPIGQRAGAMLEAARRARGLDVGALAAQLKVPVARLEALEAGDWPQLPSGPYARGLATAVCRALQIDAAPVLAGMPGAQEATLDRVAQGINRPFRGDARHGAPASGWLWVALVVIAAVIAALLLGGTPAWQWLQAASLPELSVSAPASAPDVDTPGPSSEGAVAAAPASTPVAGASTAVLNLSVSPPVTSALTPAAVAEPSAAPDPASTTLPPTPTGVASAPTGTASLRLSTTQASWVSLTDAKGQAVFSRLVAAGEVVDLGAQAPVRLTLGNAPGVSVRWRGQDQDLSAYAKLRVARLELQ